MIALLKELGEILEREETKSRCRETETYLNVKVCFLHWVSKVKYIILGI